LKLREASQKAGNTSTRIWTDGTGQIKTWTDRTGRFNAEAEFIGLIDSKIHLKKVNGVKIAVPLHKISVKDIEYVETLTGASTGELAPKAVETYSTGVESERRIDELSLHPNLLTLSKASERHKGLFVPTTISQDRTSDEANRSALLCALKERPRRHKRE
jgi:hypothetical protein